MATSKQILQRALNGYRFSGLNRFDYRQLRNQANHDENHPPKIAKVFENVPEGDVKLHKLRKEYEDWNAKCSKHVREYRKKRAELTRESDGVANFVAQCYIGLFSLFGIKYVVTGTL